MSGQCWSSEFARCDSEAWGSPVKWTIIGRTANWISPAVVKQDKDNSWRRWGKEQQSYGSWRNISPLRVIEKNRLSLLLFAWVLFHFLRNCKVFESPWQKPDNSKHNGNSQNTFEGSGKQVTKLCRTKLYIQDFMVLFLRRLFFNVPLVLPTYIDPSS